MSWSTSELRVRLARHKTALSPPVKYFTDRSKAVFLLWIFYVFVLSCVCYVFVRVCLYVLCGHLLGKGWPLGSRLWCLTVSLSLSHWYPGSGVVLDRIDSWSLHSYLLWSRTQQRHSAVDESRTSNPSIPSLILGTNQAPKKLRDTVRPVINGHQKKKTKQRS